MSMPDLWSPDAMVPRPRRGGVFRPARRVAVVPRSRIPSPHHRFPEAFFPFMGLNVYYEVGDDSMSPADVIDAVCHAYGISRGELVGCKRVRKYIPPRREAAYRLRGIGLSTTDIGRVLKRDHTTILYMLGMLKRKPSGFKVKPQAVSFLGPVDARGFGA